jgi:hypothetical protein
MMNIVSETTERIASLHTGPIYFHNIPFEQRAFKSCYTIQMSLSKEMAASLANQARLLLTIALLAARVKLFGRQHSSRGWIKVAVICCYLKRMTRMTAGFSVLHRTFR